MPELLQVFCGMPRSSLWKGKTIVSGIHKENRHGEVRVSSDGIEGDGQADLVNHGGELKAVYAYPSEHYTYWNDSYARDGYCGQELAPGSVGENLSIAGLDEKSICVGDIWCIGSSKLRVCQPRKPCFKLGMRVGDPAFVKDFLQSSLVGVYLAIEQPGVLKAGDSIDVIENGGPSIYAIWDAVFGTKQPKCAKLTQAVKQKCLSPEWQLPLVSLLEQENGG